MGDLYISKHDILVSRDANHIHVRKFGANLAVGTSAETIWTAGGAYTGFLTAADTVRVAAGGNAADTAAGANARKVVVSGLDSNWNAATEEVTLAGASASSSTTTQFIRVNRAYVSEVGTYGASNAGIITVETTSGTVVAEIAAGIAQTEMCIYTVPDGYVGFVTRVAASSETSKPINVTGHVRTNADNTVTNIQPDRTVFRRLSIEAEFSEEFTAPDQLPARADFWVDAVKTGAGTASVYAEIDINLVRIQ